MYVYQEFEPNLFTVGFYDTSGNWIPDSDHESRGDAQYKVMALNGTLHSGLIDHYKGLGKYGKVTITSDLETAQRIINSFSPWNDFNPSVVATTLGMLFNELPTTFYQEGNPNNGKPFFETVTVHSDSLITMTTYTSSEFLTDEMVDKIIELVNTYGGRMQADERDLQIEKTDFNDYAEYTIRLWWD